MASRLDVPFNIKILTLAPQRLQALKPVRSLDIFDGGSRHNFHEDGLYSVSIFGKVGSKERNRNFSYIDIRIPIFHPVIFRDLVALKRLYGGIMSGKEYATWDQGEMDFVRSDPINGETGFQFFLKHWTEIEFKQTTSDSRNELIQLIKIYQRTALTDKIIVMPAGLRDIEMDGGRTKKNEINNFYMRLLGISNTVPAAAVNVNPEIVNTARWNLQQAFNELYDFIESMIEGKKKMMLGKFASRRIFNGTRNVISAMDASVEILGAPGNIGFNSTGIGLYQFMKATLPVTRRNIRTRYLSKIFVDPNAPANLVNTKTLRAELVRISPKLYDRWMTSEGIENIISAFADESKRHKPIYVDGHYLALIYVGPDGTFRVFNDIAELPADRKAEDVHPITLAEFLYLSVYQDSGKFPLLLTRYPITGVGSIYPSKSYLKTTVKSEVRKELGMDWTPSGEDAVAYQFPITGGEFVNSLLPHSSKLGKLGADFDGDTASGNCTYSDDSIEEIDQYLQTKRAYVGADGALISSVDVDTLTHVMYNLTGD